MMKLSTVIVSWNTRELLAQCLQSIEENLQWLSHQDESERSSERLSETFVVDNCSHDGSPQMVQNQFPWVKLIENHQNSGFASANNIAIRQCQGDYVLILNPDTKIKQDALEILVRFMDAHPEVGATGPRLLNPDGSLQPSCYPTPTLSRELWRLFHLDRFRPYGTYHMHDWPVDKPREVDVVQGACLLVRREVIEQVGMLDEDYFMYTEEVDLCFRIQSAGWPLFWVPEAQVIHYGGQSTKQVATEMFLRLYESKLIYFRKHHGLVGASIYRLLLLGAALARLLLTPLTWLAPPTLRQQQQMIASNYKQLIRYLLGFRQLEAQI